MDAYETALDYARKLGAEHGENAASWYFDGNTSSATYTAVLRGLDDGDPAVLDTLPSADLSGEWADSLTGPALYRDAMSDSGAGLNSADEWTDADGREVDYFTDVCDAYETAFSDAATAAIETMARRMVAP